MSMSALWSLLGLDPYISKIQEEEGTIYAYQSFSKDELKELETVADVVQRELCDMLGGKPTQSLLELLQERLGHDAWKNKKHSALVSTHIYQMLDILRLPAGLEHKWSVLSQRPWRVRMCNSILNAKFKGASWFKDGREVIDGSGNYDIKHENGWLFEVKKSYTAVSKIVRNLKEDGLLDFCINKWPALGNALLRSKQREYFEKREENRSERPNGGVPRNAVEVVQGLQKDRLLRERMLCAVDSLERHVLASAAGLTQVTGLQSEGVSLAWYGLVSVAKGAPLHTNRLDKSKIGTAQRFADLSEVDKAALFQSETRPANCSHREWLLRANSNPDASGIMSLETFCQLAL